MKNCWEKIKSFRARETFCNACKLGFEYFLSIFFTKRHGSLFQFAPMKFLLISYPLIFSYYVKFESGLPQQWSIKYIWGALDNHPFLTDTMTGLIALTAVIIAWHRSLSTEKQIELQHSNNKISNFYSLDEHTSKLMKSVFSDSNYFRIGKNTSHKFFANLFEAPEDGIYKCNPVLTKELNKFTENFAFQFSSFEEKVLKSVTDSDEFPLKSIDSVTKGSTPVFSAYGNLSRLAYQLGLEQPNAEDTDRFRSCYAIIELVKNILSITDHLPISNSEKLTFKTDLADTSMVMDIYKDRIRTAFNLANHS